MAEKLIRAPFDNKNLVEDCLEDEVFGNFYAAKDHRVKGARHLIGILHVSNSDEYIDAMVEVHWHFGAHMIAIKVIAVPPTESFEEMYKDVFAHYRKIFKEWENPDNEDLRVKFTEFGNSLIVEFFFVND